MIWSNCVIVKLNNAYTCISNVFGTIECKFLNVSILFDVQVRSSSGRRIPDQFCDVLYSNARSWVPSTAVRAYGARVHFIVVCAVSAYVSYFTVAVTACVTYHIYTAGSPTMLLAIHLPMHISTWLFQSYTRSTDIINHINALLYLLIYSQYIVTRIIFYLRAFK